MIEFLPKWILTDSQPAFYDHESATAIEMVSKIYGKMNGLIEDYNKFADSVNTKINEFMEDTNKDYEAFQIGIRQEFQDFINVVDLKMMEQDKEIQDAIESIETKLKYSLQELLKETYENGTFSNEVKEVMRDIYSEVAVLSTRLNELSKLEDGSTTGDAELMDIRVDVEGNTHVSAGDSVRSQISIIKSDLSEITEKSYNLLPKGFSEGYSLNGLSVSYNDGVLYLQGETTARVSRTNIIVEFSLPQGTYTMSCEGFPDTDKLKGLYLVNKNTLENIAVVLTTTKTFTLDNNTDCYLSIDCYEACVFNNEVYVQIAEGENVLTFMKPSYIKANDKKAREKINELESKIEELDERYPVVEDIPLSNLNNTPSFITIFKRIMHIGDSLTEGTVNTTHPTETGVVVEGYNRPTMMERMCGNENVNLGFSGACVSEENDSNWLRFLNLSETKLAQWNETGDCYIIALGTNDILKVGAFTGDIDTDINLTDYTQNAATSVGSYAKIIQMIQEKSPKAKIFCVTIPKSRNTTSTRSVANTKIKEIACMFGCYVIDLETYGEKEGDEFTTFFKNGSHNNVLGYNLRARQYIAYIDWIIEHNLDDFRNVQFAGTDYDYVD